VGAGSWGTALAILLSQNGHQCHLWGHLSEAVERLRSDRENREFLPGIPFPNTLQPTDSLVRAGDCEHVLVVVPSEYFPLTLAQLAPHLRPNQAVAWATKGFAPGSGDLLHHIAQTHLGEQRPFAVLSGPSFAMEVARHLPTAITLAATDLDYAQQCAEIFHSDTFRVYTSDDVVGVQVGGAVKNVIAIAAGISDGLGFGANARAALITRGLSEATRLGIALGGKAETFMGLSGMGDLVLTCTDNQSRNRRFGLALAQGKGSATAKSEIVQVVEGASAARQVVSLAQRLEIEMPISEQVHAVIEGYISPTDAVQKLLARELKAE
jgi:glycerol-3-phosphate dehydrogenase (NAD(P)+)